MQDGREFAVHEAAGPHHAPAEVVADGLVSKADAEDGFPAGEGLDDIQADTSLERRARAGGEQHPVGVEGQRLLRRDLVVTEYALRHAQLAEVLDQVEREGIEVVDDEQHAAMYPQDGAGVKCQRGVASDQN